MPKEWVNKVVRKIKATGKLYGWSRVQSERLKNLRSSARSLH